MCGEGVLPAWQSGNHRHQDAEHRKPQTTAESADDERHTCYEVAEQDSIMPARLASRKAKLITTSRKSSTIEPPQESNLIRRFDAEQCSNKTRSNMTTENLHFVAKPLIRCEVATFRLIP